MNTQSSYGVGITRGYLGHLPFYAHWRLSRSIFSDVGSPSSPVLPQTAAQTLFLELLVYLYKPEKTKERFSLTVDISRATNDSVTNS